MSALLDSFKEEAEELLADLEAALLELEERSDDMELVDRAFRAMHTIKGASAMFGLDGLAAFTHQLENAFDQVRNAELVANKELIDIGLAARDHIRILLDQPPPSPELRSVEAALLGRLCTLCQSSESHTAVQADDVMPCSEAPAEDLTFRIRIKPAENAFVHGLDPLPVLRELADLGPCHVTALTAEVPPLDRLEAQHCHLAFDVILTTNWGRNAVDDVFIFVQDDWGITVEIIDEGLHSSETPEQKTLGEILLERKDAATEQIAQALSRQKEKRIGEILTEQGHVTPDKVRAALTEQTVVRKLHQQRQAKESTANVKVPADRLDSLMDLVGELVISQARLSQTANQRMDPDLLSIAEEIERLTTELRDTTLELRMLPIGTTFSRFRRLVRDLSGALGKEIELVTDGAETELDKTVIDRLGDPLVHLIRNSIDHGIEAPVARAAAGKPEKGTVRLAASHSESHVIIRIGDDGAGLDAQAIRTKAIERGLLPENAESSPQVLYNLVFEPGFSTARSISNISGRGVGMDVVRRSIESLRGKVRIDSVRGKGTTVTVELPLTLAIIEGLLVQVATERYVLPLSLVEECIELSRSQTQQANGNRLVEVRGELVPYLRLREWFNETGDRPDIEQIVVTRLGETRFGFTVDQVIGQHQTVIKTLGKLYEGVEGLAGATILGDGSLALILDVPRLFHAAGAASSVWH